MGDGQIKSIKTILVNNLDIFTSYKISFDFFLDDKILRATVCEGSIQNISCPLGQVINIKFALYGRISRSKCVDYDGGNYSL